MVLSDMTLVVFDSFLLFVMEKMFLANPVYLLSHTCTDQTLQGPPVPLSGRPGLLTMT